MKRVVVVLYSVVCCALLAAPALGASVQVPALKDNTLYESTSGSLSNGAGIYLFAGLTAMNDSRRAALAFDVAGSLPAGATINDVTLTLHMSKTIVGPEDVSLHPALADWGEGASDAPGEEGTGAASAPGDVTWIHTFFPGDLWANPGGDFAAAPSATASVDQNGFYTWGSTAAMVADAQSWLDDPANNFGWIVVGDESSAPTAKRFDSRENPNPAFQPVLTVTFDEGQPVPATSPVGIAVAIGLLLVASTAVLRRRVVRR